MGMLLDSVLDEVRLRRAAHPLRWNVFGSGRAILVQPGMGTDPNIFFRRGRWEYFCNNWIEMPGDMYPVNSSELVGEPAAGSVIQVWLDQRGLIPEFMVWNGLRVREFRSEAERRELVSAYYDAKGLGL